jgi:hypothetical protein
MTQTTFTVTDADLGTAIGTPDGFMVSLSMTTPPPLDLAAIRPAKLKQCGRGG